MDTYTRSHSRGPTRPTPHSSIAAGKPDSPAAAAAHVPSSAGIASQLRATTGLLFRPQGVPPILPGSGNQRGEGGREGDDAGDGGAVGGEEGEAEDGADRAAGAARAGAVHHAHHLRRRPGARPSHHLRRLGPRQGSWA